MPDVRHYTKEEIEKNLALIEVHAKQFEQDKLFCLDCLQKHLTIVQGLADEGVGFFPEARDWFTELAKWAAEKKELLPKLTSELAAQIGEEARQLRKDLQISRLVEKLAHHHEGHIEEDLMRDQDLILHSIPHMEGSPGIETPKATRGVCRFIPLDGKRLVFAKGVIGALDESQQAKLCEEMVEMTDKFGLKRRIRHWREAVEVCKGELKGVADGARRMTHWITCMSRELEKRGVKR